nr:sensor histidine kinase [Saccharomonospora saliphila]
MTAALRESTGQGFSHEALFYSDDASYLAGTVPFVREGLARGEPVAVAVPSARLTSLADALADDARHVRLIDMEEAGRNPGRIIPSVLRAFADAHSSRVRIIGEPIWAGRTDYEYPACVQHEALINASFAGREATILCPYDASMLDASVLADAEATHPVLVDANGCRESPCYAPDEAFERQNHPLTVPDGAVSTTFDLDTMAGARHVGTAFAADAGVAGQRLQDVALVIGELCANSVQHGGGGGVLRMWRSDDGVVCEVADQGQPTDKLAGRRPASPYQDGGRGLLLVNQVAELVRTHVGPDGMTMRVSLSSS